MERPSARFRKIGLLAVVAILLFADAAAAGVDNRLYTRLLEQYVADGLVDYLDDDWSLNGR